MSLALTMLAVLVALDLILSGALRLVLLGVWLVPIGLAAGAAVLLLGQLAPILGVAPAVSLAVLFLGGAGAAFFRLVAELGRPVALVLVTIGLLAIVAGLAAAVPG